MGKNLHIISYLFFSIIFVLIHSAVMSQVSVVNQHNDNYRSGWNRHEKILTTGNVKKGSFGFLFQRNVDDQIYAQPLIVTNVPIPSVGKRNVVYVATVNNTVYAFDADSVNINQPYWSKNLNPLGGRAAANGDIGSWYQDFSGRMGIVGTPVIDSLTSTLYVVVKSYTSVYGFQQYLHALDLATGAEQANSPKLINAQIAGNGDGSIGGTISFDPLKQNQRSGLLLMNGVVFIAWASHGDTDPYHGWILGYDKSTLELKYTYATTPEGYKGGIWMAGSGIAADSLGNIYVAVGNGSVGLNGDATNVTNRSESALKLTPSGLTLAVSSYFTPMDWPDLENADLDFGVTGLLLIPGTRHAVSGAKDGNIYLMNRDTMGGYSAAGNQVVQQYNQNSGNAHNIASLSYYQGSQSGYVFTWSDNVTLKALPYITSLKQFDLLNVKQSVIQGPVGYNGAFLSVSSNGTVDSTAILWATHAASGNANQSTRPGILRAIQAVNINNELWNTSLTASDDPGNYAKFSCPTIANGKVYLATFSNKLVVYGLQQKVVVGLKENNFLRPHVYPNPARDYVKIAIPNGEAAIVRLMDISGRVFIQEEGVYGDMELGTTSLPNGIYLIQIRTAGAVFVEKLMVQK